MATFASAHNSNSGRGPFCWRVEQAIRHHHERLWETGDMTAKAAMSKVDHQVLLHRVIETAAKDGQYYVITLARMKGSVESRCVCDHQRINRTPYASQSATCNQGGRWPWHPNSMMFVPSHAVVSAH